VMRNRRTQRRLGLLGAAGASVLLAACDGGTSSPAPAAPGDRPAAPALTEAAPASREIVLSGGFTYDTEARTPGFPGVLTVDLGSRVRLYTLSDRVVPATVTLVSADGRELNTIRLDLPPGGTIRAPEGTVGPEVASVRVSALVDSSGRVPSDPIQIGAPAETLSAATEAIPGGESTSTVLTHETGLQGEFGTVLIQAVPSARQTRLAGVPASNLGTHTAAIVSDAWSGPGQPTDAHWLNERVRAALQEMTARPVVVPAIAPGPTPAD